MLRYGRDFSRSHTARMLPSQKSRPSLALRKNTPILFKNAPFPQCFVTAVIFLGHIQRVCSRRKNPVQALPCEKIRRFYLKMRLFPQCVVIYGDPQFAKSKQRRPMAKHRAAFPYLVIQCRFWALFFAFLIKIQSQIIELLISVILGAQLIVHFPFGIFHFRCFKL